MAHSNQLREFVITSKGFTLIPPYSGQGGVLTGSSRINQEAKEKAAAVQRHFATLQKEQKVSRKRLALETQASSLQAELVAVERETEIIVRENKPRGRQATADRANFGEKPRRKPRGNVPGDLVKNNNKGSGKSQETFGATAVRRGSHAEIAGGHQQPKENLLGSFRVAM